MFTQKRESWKTALSLIEKRAEGGLPDEITTDKKKNYLL
jgi:hypothetical protein